MRKRYSLLERIDIIVMGFIFLIIIVLPIIFARENGMISWRSIFKVWQDKLLLIPLFAINHWLLVPKLALRKKFSVYIAIIMIIITCITAGYYFYDQPKQNPQRSTQNRQPINNPGPPRSDNPPENGRRRDKPPQAGNVNNENDRAGNESRNKTQPVPPYADLLLFSLMIVAVDTGLSFTKSWHSNEEEKIRLEKENISAQLGILRNQVSPHFLMNTLNNIYSLIDGDRERSKQAVMRLSRLMRYLLYENRDGKVLLSKEFEFIRNYTELIKMRYVDDVEIKLFIPDHFADIEIPSLIFISFIENAFKFGTSYEKWSFIEINFSLDDNELLFSCRNSKTIFSSVNSEGGIGLKNSRQRLDLIYGSGYSLDISETEEIFTVILKIPLA